MNVWARISLNEIIQSAYFTWPSAKGYKVMRLLVALWAKVIELVIVWPSAKGYKVIE